MSAAHSPSARLTVFARDGWACRACGFCQTEDERRKIVERGGLGRYLTVDHIVPKAKGGRSSLENLQTLCNHCNRVKADSCDPADLIPERVKKKRVKTKQRGARSKLVNGPRRSKAGQMLIHDPRCDEQFCFNLCPVYLERSVFA